MDPIQAEKPVETVFRMVFGEGQEEAKRRYGGKEAGNSRRMGMETAIEGVEKNRKDGSKAGRSRKTRPSGRSAGLPALSFPRSAHCEGRRPPRRKRFAESRPLRRTTLPSAYPQDRRTNPLPKHLRQNRRIDEVGDLPNGRAVANLACQNGVDGGRGRFRGVRSESASTDGWAAGCGRSPRERSCG